MSEADNQLPYETYTACSNHFEAEAQCEREIKRKGEKNGESCCGCIEVNIKPVCLSMCILSCHPCSSVAHVLNRTGAGT